VNQTVFNLGELSYFTGHSLSSLQRKIQKGRKSIRHFDAGAKKVSLQIASKVYEASDVGFTPTEICEYAQCNSAQYKHAVDQRNTLEHLLVRNLQILFPSRNQQKPYL
jgi:hypothetical protein